MSNDDVAPALKLLNDDYKTMKFIGHTEEGSPYQGPPNAQVDAQWERLTKGYSLKSLLPCSWEMLTLKKLDHSVSMKNFAQKLVRLIML